MVRHKKAFKDKIDMIRFVFQKDNWPHLGDENGNGVGCEARILPRTCCSTVSQKGPPSGGHTQRASVWACSRVQRESGRGAPVLRAERWTNGQQWNTVIMQCAVSKIK